MKKIIFSLLVLAIPLYASSQIKVAGYFDGYWGEWENAYISAASIYDRIDYYFPYVKIYGDYSGFCTYLSDTHPSSYTFKFQISNYSEPDKKKKKEYLKANKWYEYSGIVEYYVRDDLPTILDVLKCGSAFGRIPMIQPSEKSARKKTARATIQIAPYKDHPKVYNIWFEGVGVGIDLNTVYFNQ